MEECDKEIEQLLGQLMKERQRLKALEGKEAEHVGAEAMPGLQNEDVETLESVHLDEEIWGESHCEVNPPLQGA